MTTRLSTVTTRAAGSACATPAAGRGTRRCRRPVDGRARLVAPRVPPAAPAVRVARPHRLHLTERGRLLVLVTLALLMLTAFAVGRSASSEASVDPATPAALTQRTVAPGDTLWSVAHELAPRRDPRDVVEDITKLNHLRTPVLQAGQQLLLPALR